MATTHIEAGSSARPRVTFYVDGVASNLDTGVPAVTVTRPDLTTIASGAVSAVGGATGTYDFVLAAQAKPTVLTISWVGTIGGQVQTLTTTVEVLGTFLFGLAELRAWQVGSTPNAFQDPVKWPAATLAAVRAEVTDDFAARTGNAHVPRFARETLSGDGGYQLVLGKLRALELLSVKVNGAAQSLSSFSLRPSGVLEATSGYLPLGGVLLGGRSNVVAEYVHGFATPPPAVSRAGMARAAMLLDPSPVGSASSWTSPEGTTYTFDPAGRALGSGINHYGVPKIAEVLNHPAYSASSMVVA